MKVGDKVYVEVEVKEFNDFTFTDKYFSTYDRREVITQLPIQEGRWMMVSDDEKDWTKAFVIGKIDGLFFSDSLFRWIYAKELPTKRKLTMQEISEKFNEDVDNIEIECQK